MSIYQVELTTNHGSLTRIMERLRKLDYRVSASISFLSSHEPISLALLFPCPTFVTLSMSCSCCISSLYFACYLVRSVRQLAAVHLSDASYLTDPSKYVSVLLLSLRTMLQLEMPHVNVLSKMDVITKFGDLRESSSGRALTAACVVIDFPLLELSVLVRIEFSNVSLKICPVSRSSCSFQSGLLYRGSRPVSTLNPTGAGPEACSVWRVEQGHLRDRRGLWPRRV